MQREAELVRDLQPRGNTHLKKLLRDKRQEESDSCLSPYELRLRQAKRGLRSKEPRYKCVETGDCFVSVPHISRSMSLPHGTVQSHLEGRLLHVRGYHFERLQK